MDLLEGARPEVFKRVGLLVAGVDDYVQADLGTNRLRVFIMEVDSLEPAQASSRGLTFKVIKGGT